MTEGDTAGADPRREVVEGDREMVEGGGTIGEAERAMAEDGRGALASVREIREEESSG